MSSKHLSKYLQAFTVPAIRIALSHSGKAAMLHKSLSVVIDKPKYVYLSTWQHLQLDSLTSSPLP